MVIVRFVRKPFTFRDHPFLSEEVIKGLLAGPKGTGRFFSCQDISQKDTRGRGRSVIVPGCGMIDSLSALRLCNIRFLAPRIKYRRNTAFSKVYTRVAKEVWGYYRSCRRG